MNSAMHRTVPILARARNYLVLGLLGTLISLLLLRIAFVVEDRWGHDAFIRWFGLALFTLVSFAVFVCDSERVLRSWRFWALSAILLALHLIGFWIVLTHVEEWKLSWFMVMVIEYPLFLFLRNKFVRASFK
jgi:hypothetical protein